LLRRDSKTKDKEFRSGIEDLKTMNVNEGECMSVKKLSIKKIKAVKGGATGAHPKACTYSYGAGAGNCTK
jgi:hypothetical protein